MFRRLTNERLENEKDEANLCIPFFIKKKLSSLINGWKRQPKRNFCYFVSKWSWKSIISWTDETLKLLFQANITTALLKIKHLSHMIWYSQTLRFSNGSHMLSSLNGLLRIRNALCTAFKHGCQQSYWRWFYFIYCFSFLISFSNLIYFISMKQMNINSSSISCKEYQQYCNNFSLKAANVNFAMQQNEETISVKKALSVNVFVVAVW